MTQPLKIGPYEAGKFVARDAHASVCRVIDPRDGRTLTAKMYSPTGGPDPRVLSRWHEEFADEVRHLRRHGSDLVPIEAAGRAGDLAWVVMDVPKGDFLSTLLGDQPLADDRALAILGRMAAALDRLHAAGLVHRSLKPSNVIVTDNGATLFLDTLLLGRFAEAVVAGALSLDRVTCAAPEVVLGYRQRAASNQYSLAVLAHRALTGVWPHMAGNSIDYAYATVYQEAVAPSSHRASLPAQVDAVVARGLAKESEDRYATCTEFVSALDAALRQSGLPDAMETVEPVVNDEAAATHPEPLLEWFESPTTVLELVPEPPSTPPAPLRAVRVEAPRPEPVKMRAVPMPQEAEPEVAEPVTPDAEATDVVSSTPEVTGVERGGAEDRAEPADVILPEPLEQSQDAAVTTDTPASRPLKRRLGGWAQGVRGLLWRLVPRVGGRRVPDHLMREAYLADWRGDAARSGGSTEEWSDPITPEWALAVLPTTPGWLRVDGRYAGPAPAEISIPGRSGKRVRVELMRDGVAVATTELKLHPLMDKTWEPNEA